MKQDRIILKTALATAVLLLFFFAQGAIVVIMEIDGVPSLLIRGAVIWALVVITLAYYIIRYKEISGLGFRGMEQYAGENTAAFREDQGKYHAVDQGEADLENGFPQFRAASYVQKMAQREKHGGYYHRLSHAALQPRSADDAPEVDFLRHPDAQG